MSQGGRIPGTINQCAFEIASRRSFAIPVLIAVPHAGRTYPADLVQRMRDPAEAALRLEDRFVDLLAAKLADRTGAALLIAHAPRALIDLNRSPGDMDWSMVEGRPAATVTGGRSVARADRAAGAGGRARGGLGLIPRRLPGMGEIWRSPVSAAEVETRLALVHRPYHAALSQMLARMRDQWGAALLVDLHSMPPLASGEGGDQAAQFVIGDRFGASCASDLAAFAIDHLEDAGRAVAHNRPYAGGYVLDRHASPASDIHAMQIEVCRSTYLDAALRSPGPGLETVAALLTGLVERLAAEIAGSCGLAEAAE